MGTRGLVASVGVAVDLLVGDPPNAAHPVAWHGRFASWCEQRLWRDARSRGLLVVGMTTLPVLGLGALVDGSPLLQTLALAITLGGRSLGAEALAVAERLDADDLPGARTRLRRIVGRDTEGLSASEVARAAIESVAENTTDALTAPWLWFLAGGAKGALVFRAANTLDAMFGHRSPRYLRFGWAAARLDDWLAAPGALVAVGAVLAARPRRGAEVLRQLPRAVGHPSLNAGLVEAAFAGALGVRLGGTNSYQGVSVFLPLLDAGPLPDAAAVRRSVRLLRHVSYLLVAAGAVSGVRRR